MEVSTIGLDLAKNVFQVHGGDKEDTVVVRKALRRAQMLPFFSKLPPCLVGIEACRTSHHWARYLGRRARKGLRLGNGDRASLHVWNIRQ